MRQRQGGAGAGEGGAGQAQRGEDAALGLVGVGAAGDLFDDQAEQDVVGVRVGEAAAFGRRVGECDAHGLTRRHRNDASGVRGEVGESAGVGEQGPQGQRAAVVARSPHQTGQMLLDGVGQRQAFLVGQLQHDRGDERLGDAAGAEVVGTPDARSGLGVARTGAVQRQQRRGRGAAPRDQQRKERVRRRDGKGRGCGRGQGEQGHGHRNGE